MNSGAVLRRWRSRIWNRQNGIYIGTIVLIVMVWHIAAQFTPELFLPTPLVVAEAAVELFRTGGLIGDVGISMFRILSGWALGTAIAVPTGIIAGRLVLVRTALEPIVNFFRFIPPIAFISLTIIWFGVGETSRIALIIYASAFLVFINTLTGAQQVEHEKIRAATSLGASRLQVVWSVIVPATVPSVVTGMRLAMGTAFMTVVAAELVAAQSGVGFVIYSSRVFGATEIAFVGIAVLGLMGLVTDGLLRLMLRRVTYRFVITY